MRYFSYLQNHEKKRIFYKEPNEFDTKSDMDFLRYAVGALLYVPAIQMEMLKKCINREIEGIISLAICLEDSVGVYGEEEAIKNIEEIFRVLRCINERNEQIPLIFIRPKNVLQINRIGYILQANKDLISGIIIPKANGEIIYNFLEALDQLECGELYIMPIIESMEFILANYKQEAFTKLYDVISNYKNRILNVRIGVTDLLGSFKCRRNSNLTIYDNVVFNSFASDILSFINDGSLNIPISGGVSEYYNMLKEDILESYLKEIQIDKLNGFIGKTVIHPLQMNIVQAMSIITYEDYMDAKKILQNVNSKFAVSGSVYSERMNEVNPHLLWSEKIMKLSEVYGVLNEGVESCELFRF